MADLVRVFGVNSEVTMNADQRYALPNVEPSREEIVQLEGCYEVDPIPGGKRFQGAWLVLDDGTRFVIGYRPIAAHSEFIDKRVVVKGRPYMPGPDTQHIMATHLEIHSIELAPGETPYANPPTEVPAPPLVRTAGELAARCGHWVRVQGTLESVRKDPDGYLNIALLRLQDGSPLQAQNVRLAEWSRYEGKQVTVLSRVEEIETAGTTACQLVGWYAIK
jgi:hypothetical protein